MFRCDDIHAHFKDTANYLNGITHKEGYFRTPNMISSFSKRVRYAIGCILLIGLFVIFVSNVGTGSYGTRKGQRVLEGPRVLNHELRPRNEDLIRKMINSYRNKTAMTRAFESKMNSKIYGINDPALDVYKPVDTPADKWKAFRSNTFGSNKVGGLARHIHDGSVISYKNKTLITTRKPPLDRARGVPIKSTIQQTNECKKLAPSVYQRNEARLFTADELNITRYAGTEPLIPKILHQTWNDYFIPKPAVPFVKSIIRQHPNWQYWFWTQADIQCYIKQKHPEFTSLYNDYDAMIYKTDVMRYFLLYDYGGFYLDLDVEALKPLDVWAHISSCILSHETYEHTFFGHMRAQPNVMTTILATRPNHPYYKLLQENLMKYHKTCPKNVLYSTGPFYIDDIYQLHVRTNNMSLEENNITVIHPR